MIEINIIVCKWNLYAAFFIQSPKTGDFIHLKPIDFDYKILDRTTIINRFNCQFNSPFTINCYEKISYKPVMIEIDELNNMYNNKKSNKSSIELTELQEYLECFIKDHNLD